MVIVGMLQMRNSDQMTNGKMCPSLMHTLCCITHFKTIVSLNVFAFELQPAWQVLSAQNSGENYTISPFCETTVCRESQLASYVLIAFRLLITFIKIIHSRWRLLTVQLFSDSHRFSYAMNHSLFYTNSK